MTNKFHVWLGQRESEEGGYRSVHNLVRRFLTLHGLLVCVRGPLPDWNRRSEEQKKKLKDMGLAHGMSDADKMQKCEEKMAQCKELEKKIQATLSEYRVAFLKIIPEAPRPAATGTLAWYLDPTRYSCQKPECVSGRGGSRGLRGKQQAHDLGLSRVKA